MFYNPRSTIGRGRLRISDCHLIHVTATVVMKMYLSLVRSETWNLKEENIRAVCNGTLIQVMSFACTKFPDLAF